MTSTNINIDSQISSSLPFDLNIPLPVKGVGPDQQFYGHGKLLISGEYFVIDGAQALALPTKFGQTLNVKYNPCFDRPKLTWISYDSQGHIWLRAHFEFWHFQCLDHNPSPQTLFLQRILLQARKQNPHFLREEVDVLVETYLEFPLHWGLGSSSTLLYNIAQWAYISPFELYFALANGSGYDMVCAQSNTPVLYEKKACGPVWSSVTFDPSFKSELYFVYLGQKQDSRQAVDYYHELRPFDPIVLNQVTQITRDMLKATGLSQFAVCIEEHESLVGKHLNLTPVKTQRFADYWGAVKSLGAWGGDFALVTSDRGSQATRDYFNQKGLDIVFVYEDLILENRSQLKTDFTSEAETLGAELES